MRVLYDSYGEIFYVVEEKDWPMFTHTTKRRQLFVFFIWEKGNAEVCNKLKKREWKQFDEVPFYSIDPDKKKLLKDGVPVDLIEFKENEDIKNLYDKVITKGNKDKVTAVEIAKKILEHYYKNAIED